ncbi:hypothetical protein ABS71_06975 [bacterium SCN 62-11]|nr:MAG: hypothetical protein ABS71_06975 [bacterium SCN 62-11]
MRGFTLAEAVVVVALLSLLVILAERLLIPSLRLQRRETALAQTQQRLQLALAQLRELLQSSGSGGLYYLSGTLSCQSVHEVLSDGELAWDVRPCLVYRDAQRRELVRLDWKSSPTSVPGWSSTTPLALNEANLQALQDDPQHVRRLLVNEIDQFSVTHEANGIRLGREIDVTLESWAGDRHTRWSGHVSLRNSW